MAGRQLFRYIAWSGSDCGSSRPGTRILGTIASSSLQWFLIAITREGSTKGMSVATAKTMALCAARRPACSPASGPASRYRSGATTAGTGSRLTSASRLGESLLLKMISPAMGSSRRATTSINGLPSRSSHILSRPMRLLRPPARIRTESGSIAHNKEAHTW